MGNGYLKKSLKKIHMNLAQKLWKVGLEQLVKYPVYKTVVFYP